MIYIWRSSGQFYLTMDFHLFFFFQRFVNIQNTIFQSLESKPTIPANIFDKANKLVLKKDQCTWIGGQRIVSKFKDMQKKN